MNIRRLETFIGFAIKSRSIVFGEDNIKALGRQVIVVLDANASEKYKERIRHIARSPVYEVPDLPNLTHRENVHSIAILDNNLASAITQCIREK